ncbi:MAG: MoxR family ATPase [Lachnospiraceae bacterium]|jgi:nitric oxide reductase NorQ protein|nr:MoxR family ATPase [Lachnospiraceae bacterium]
MTEDLQFLEEQQVSPKLIREVEKFREAFWIPEEVRNRIVKPPIPFYGKEILEMAIAALLQGENVLLSGSKATGKNILAENLAFVFRRPSYNISFHVNTDSSALIGTDTFVDNEVRLRKGPVYQCALSGGFGIFDEINMAKNDAVSVLHATLDYRRIIDVPGYDKIELHPATRFIGTMNYGYAGTKELNEALVSRFLVIDMPPLTEETLLLILKKNFPDAKEEGLKQFAGLFLDLQLKAQNSEISTKPMDLRGMIGALKIIREGISPRKAVTMGITNKSFDIFEKEIIGDIVMTRIPEEWTGEEVFHGRRA